MGRLTKAYIHPFFVYLVAGLFLQSCIRSNKAMDTGKFPYMVTFSAATDFPSEVHEGFLADEKKQLICGVPKAGTEEGPWQSDGSEAGMGGDIIPSHLDLTYVSYAEKKFWRVDADLPKAKILAAFRKGFIVKGTPGEKGNQSLVHETFGRLTIGAAPGGVIVVWLSKIHHRMEICRLQAKEVVIDVNDFYDNPHNRTQKEFFDELYKISVSDSTKAEIAKNGIPYGLWDKYREKFNYRFLLRPYDENDHFTFQSQQYFNGEANLFYPPYFDKNEYTTASLPYILNAGFTTYNTEIHFDFEETLKTFKALQEKHPKEPIDILLTPTFQYNHIKVSVKCRDTEIPLAKANVKQIWGG